MKFFLKLQKKQIPIPVILLLLKTNASLEEMRKAIEELENEGKISLSVDPASTYRQSSKSKTS